MKINIFLTLQILIVSAFCVIFAMAAYHMFSDPTPSDFVRSTYGEFKTLLLGLMALDYLKMKIQAADDKFVKPPDTEETTTDLGKS